MIVKSLFTDEHVTKGRIYVVAYKLDRDVIVYDDDDELWDLLAGEFLEVEEC